jgi:hypothetical protein
MFTVDGTSCSWISGGAGSDVGSKLSVGGGGRAVSSPPAQAINVIKTERITISAKILRISSPFPKTKKRNP